VFIKRLKELRARDKLSQADLAKLLNVAAGTIGMWETGERNPDRMMLIKIADLFNVSLDYLAGRPTKEAIIEGLIDGLTEEEVMYLSEQAEFYRYRKKLPPETQADSAGLTDTGRNGIKPKFKGVKKKQKEA